MGTSSMTWSVIELSDDPALLRRQALAMINLINSMEKQLTMLRRDFRHVINDQKNWASAQELDSQRDANAHLTREIEELTRFKEQVHTLYPNIDLTIYNEFSLE